MVEPSRNSKHYELFLNGEPTGSAESRSISTLRQDTFQKLEKMVGRDLVKSPAQLGTLYFGLSIVGYVASLTACAQNSLGLVPFAHKMAASLHTLPDPWCPIICGSIFTGIPFLLSLIFLNRFQQRYLLTKMWWFFASIPVLATLCMLLLPQKLQHTRMVEAGRHILHDTSYLGDVGWMGFWVVSAILTPYLFESVLFFIIRQKKAT